MLRPRTSTFLLLFLFLLLHSLANSMQICDNCLAPDCSFTPACGGVRVCEAYSFTPECAFDSSCVGGYCCIPTYYISFSSLHMNYTYCVACNYTYPGCILCGYQGNCTQCAPEYILINGTCFTQDLNPVGVTLKPETQLWLAFVVILTVLGVFFGILGIFKYRAYIRISQGGPETPRRNTELIEK